VSLCGSDLVGVSVYGGQSKSKSLIFRSVAHTVFIIYVAIH